MLKTLAYPLAIERHEKEGGYLAYFPSLPGCQTWGETYEAAVHNAEEALAVYIETLAANGDPIPEPNMIEGPVSLGVMVCADVAA
jgi:antitoxin HicB